MANFRSLDGIKEDLKKEIDITITLLKAWEKVTFPTKKNGEPFARLAQNIDGATLKQNAFALQPGENYLEVCAKTNIGAGKYADDAIDLYSIIKYMDKDDERLAKTQNFAPKQTLLEQIYIYDLQDIKQAITGRINYFKARLQSLEQAQEKAEKAYNNFETTYKLALRVLEADTKNKELAIMIRDTITQQHSYY